MPIADIDFTWNACVSSSVTHWAYDAATQTFAVRFHPGRVGTAAAWAYSPVPADLIETVTEQRGGSVGALVAMIRRMPDIAAMRLDAITEGT